MLKRPIKSIFNLFGLELRRIKNIEKRDAFDDQKKLLGEKETPLIIFDVGAYIGQVTTKYRALFPKAMIYSFEPFPDSFRELQKKSQSLGQVKPFQLAIADKTGTKTFYVNADRLCNSLLQRPSNPRKYYDANSECVAEIEVDVATIDHFCQKESIAEIDILKLDVEGTELLALKGASEKLTVESICLIYTEVMFVPHYEGGIMFYELYKCLSDYGYTLFDLYDLKHAKNGQLRWGNAIFVSEALRKKVVDAR